MNRNERLALAVVRSFCSDSDDRRETSRPWHDGKFAYGSDGRSAVRVLMPRVSDCEWNDTPVPTLFNDDIFASVGDVVSVSMEYIAEIDRSCVISLDGSRVHNGPDRCDIDADGLAYVYEVVENNAHIHIPGAGIFSANRVMRALGAVRVMGGRSWEAVVYVRKDGMLRISGRGGDGMTVDVVIMPICTRGMIDESSIVVDACTGEMLSVLDVRKLYEKGLCK